MLPPVCLWETNGSKENFLRSRAVEIEHGCFSLVRNRFGRLH